MSFLGVLNLRWTSLGPLSSTKFVSTVTSSAGAWLANRLEFCEKKLWQMLSEGNISYRGLDAKVCPKEDSLGVQVVGDVDDNGRSVHDGNYIVNGDVNTTHSLKSWCFKDSRKVRIGTSSPAGRLHGFLSIKSRLVPTQREGILNKQLRFPFRFKFQMNSIHLNISSMIQHRREALPNATYRTSWENLQVPDTPVRVLQPVPSTVNAELVWPDEEEETEEEEDELVTLELAGFEVGLSWGQPAEQCPHSPVPVTWFPPASTRVLHQNFPWRRCFCVDFKIFWIYKPPDQDLLYNWIWGCHQIEKGRHKVCLVRDHLESWVRVDIFRCDSIS